MRTTWPTVLLAIDILHVLGGGLLYLLYGRGMTYHEVVLGSDWDKVPVGTQTLVTGLMRGTGGSGVVISLFAAMLLLQVPRRPLAVAGGLALLHLVQLWVISTVAIQSGAEPPWQPAAAGLVTVMVAGLGAHRSARGS